MIDPPARPLLVVAPTAELAARVASGLDLPPGAWRPVTSAPALSRHVQGCAAGTEYVLAHDGRTDTPWWYEALSILRWHGAVQRPHDGVGS